MDHFEMTMKALNNRKRMIRVYQPKDKDKRYPVIYMHDGQNLFYDFEASYEKSWNIPHHFNKNHLSYIVVGIDSGEGLTRLDELSPWENNTIHQSIKGIDRSVGGLGDHYLEFIVSELKPFIDTNYPTLPSREYTMIAGSSMGGVMSLYSILKRSDIFGKAACLSNAFWFSEQEIYQYIKNIQIENHIKIYMDFGTKEDKDSIKNNANIKINQRVYELLKDKENIEVQYNVIKEGVHHESAWEIRFPDVVKYLFT